MKFPNYYTEDEITDEEWQEWRETLQDRYRVYIMNPAHSEGVNFSLWLLRDDDTEWPLVSSNTGGFATFNSQHDDVGDHIQPTDDFFNGLGYMCHEAMSFMPHTYLQYEFGDRLDDHKRSHEAWALSVLVPFFVDPQSNRIRELDPLARWADSFSEFQLPYVSKHLEENND